MTDDNTNDEGLDNALDAIIEGALSEKLGIGTKASWVPYEGDQGGVGWRNTDTDEVIYDDKPPGGTPDGVPDDLDELKEQVESGELTQDDIEEAYDDGGDEGGSDARSVVDSVLSDDHSGLVKDDAAEVIEGAPDDATAEELEDTLYDETLLDEGDISVIAEEVAGDGDSSGDTDDAVRRGADDALDEFGGVNAIDEDDRDRVRDYVADEADGDVERVEAVMDDLDRRDAFDGGDGGSDPSEVDGAGPYDSVEEEVQDLGPAEITEVYMDNVGDPLGPPAQLKDEMLEELDGDEVDAALDSTFGDMRAGGADAPDEGDDTSGRSDFGDKQMDIAREALEDEDGGEARSRAATAALDAVDGGTRDHLENAVSNATSTSGGMGPTTTEFDIDDIDQYVEDSAQVSDEDIEAFKDEYNRNLDDLGMARDDVAGKASLEEKLDAVIGEKLEDAGLDFSDVGTKASWVPYQGDRGGEGWKNTDTGNITYDDEPPGGVDDSALEQMEGAVANRLAGASDDNLNEVYGEVVGEEPPEGMDASDRAQAVVDAADDHQLAGMAQRMGAEVGAAAGSSGAIETDGTTTAGSVSEGDSIVIDDTEADVGTVSDMGGGFYIAARDENDEVHTARVGPDHEFEVPADDGGGAEVGGLAESDLEGVADDLAEENGSYREARSEMKQRIGELDDGLADMHDARDRNEFVDGLLQEEFGVDGPADEIADVMDPSLLGDWDPDEYNDHLDGEPGAGKLMGTIGTSPDGELLVGDGEMQEGATLRTFDPNEAIEHARGQYEETYLNDTIADAAAQAAEESNDAPDDGGSTGPKTGADLDDGDVGKEVSFVSNGKVVEGELAEVGEDYRGNTKIRVQPEGKPDWPAQPYTLDDGDEVHVGGGTAEVQRDELGMALDHGTPTDGRGGSAQATADGEVDLQLGWNDTSELANAAGQAAEFMEKYDEGTAKERQKLKSLRSDIKSDLPTSPSTGDPYDPESVTVDGEELEALKQNFNKVTEYKRDQNYPEDQVEETRYTGTMLDNVLASAQQDAGGPAQKAGFAESVVSGVVSDIRDGLGLASRGDAR